ncbi:MAG: putative type pilus biosis protein PilF [Proteobacteria bacterium]|nr:putative type pilus biosis protein PilF [Pseudomonadota bacterium]
MSLRRQVLTVVLLSLAACYSTPKKDPNTPSASEIYVQKGVQYMETGQLEFAMQDLQHAIDLDGKNVEAHNAMAVLYERLNRPLDADKHYQRALSLDSDNASTLNNYGRFLCGQGHYEKSMQYFNQVIESKLYPLPWVALTNAGLCARSSGRRKEGEEYLRKALEANPTFGPALLGMAKLSLESGQYMSARAFLQRAEATGPLNADGLWLGVQAEHALGNEEAASGYLNDLRSRFPDSREAAHARKLHLN